VVCLSWSSFYTTCRTDLTHWPYDTHVCEAQVAPWRLQPKELELHIRKRTVGHTPVALELTGERDEGMELVDPQEVTSRMFSLLPQNRRTRR
jgi:hypothetical protein